MVTHFLAVGSKGIPQVPLHIRLYMNKHEYKAGVAELDVYATHMGEYRLALQLKINPVTWKL